MWWGVLGRSRRSSTRPLALMAAPSLVYFVASPAGRAPRVAAGLDLVSWGLAWREMSASKAAAASSLVPLTTGALDGDAARRAVS